MKNPRKNQVIPRKMFICLKRSFVKERSNHFIKLQEFDFNELEKATEYEGGYTEKSQIIIDFWDIIHGLSLDSKKKLLEFTTGE